MSLTLLNNHGKTDLRSCLHFVRRGINGSEPSNLIHREKNIIFKLPEGLERFCSEVFIDAMDNCGFNYDFNGEKLFTDNELDLFSEYGLLTMTKNESNWKAHMCVDFVRCFWEKHEFKIRYTKLKKQFPNHRPTSYYLLCHFGKFRYEKEFILSPGGRSLYSDESLLNDATLLGLSYLASFHSRRGSYTGLLEPIEDGYSIVYNVHNSRQGLLPMEKVTVHKSIDECLSILDRLLERNQINAAK